MIKIALNDVNYQADLTRIAFVVAEVLISEGFGAWLYYVGCSHSQYVPKSY